MADVAASTAATTAASGAGLRAALALCGFLVAGACCGLCATAALPAGGVFAADRIETHLRRGHRADLEAVIALGADDLALAPAAALAHTLLWDAYSADDDHAAAAVALLSRAGATGLLRPEALYARALLASRGFVATDKGLADAVLQGPQESVWVLLARATVAPVDERASLLERAALIGPPVLHATHVFARHQAAVGDLELARASLNRIVALDDQHVPATVTAVMLELQDGLRPAEERRRPARARGAPSPGTPPLSEVEQRADTLRQRVGDDDARLLALALWTSAVAHGDTDPRVDAWRTAMDSSPSRRVLYHALELALITGDAGTASALATAADTVTTAGTNRAPTSLDLRLAQARARILAAVDDGERAARLKRVPVARDDVYVAPLGTLALSFGDTPWPVLTHPAPDFFPEARLQRFAADARRLQRRDAQKVPPVPPDDAAWQRTLARIEGLARVDRAIDAGNFGAANTLLTELDTAHPAQADIEMARARLAGRQGNVVGVNKALDAAVQVAGDDPDVLLAAARLFLDVENRPGARNALKAFQRLGFKSAAASAATALLEAEEGDYARARAAIADAERLGGADDSLTLRAVILANRLSAPHNARSAADRLLPRDDVVASDVVATWIAEAALRAGEHERAESTLKAIVDTRPKLGDAQLFFANAIAYNPTRKKEALVAASKAVALTPKGTALAGEARAQLAALKKPTRRRR